MIRFTLSITGLVIERDALDGSRDLVAEVSWELIGAHESGVSAMRYGTQPLGDRERHAVVAGMDPAMVSDWLSENLGASVMRTLKDDITQRIMKVMTSPRYSVFPPWVVAATPQPGAPDVVSTDPARALELTAPMMLP